MTFPSGARLGSYEWNGDRWMWSPTLKDFQVGTAYLPGPAEAPNPALFRPAPTRKSKQAADAWWKAEENLLKAQAGSARRTKIRARIYRAVSCVGRGIRPHVASSIATEVMDVLTEEGVI